MGIIGVALARNAQTARAVVIPFECDASAAVGEFVYADPSNDFKVLVNTDNTQSEQTIGVILEKPSNTDANVLIVGFADGYSGLTRGGKIYLSVSGGITQAPPTTGYVQQLGVAVAETEILFKPEWTRVLRS